MPTPTPPADAFLAHCPACGGADLPPADLLVPEGPIRACAACGHLVSSCSRASYEAGNADWDTEDGTWPGARALRRLRSRRQRDFDTAAALLGRPLADLRLLDVGASNGATVAIATALGLQAQGVEPSPRAAGNGRARGFVIHQGYLADLRLAAASFDVLTLYEVIEHVDAPASLLAECRRVLCPGGVLIVGTGNTDSWTRHVLGAHWDFFDMRLHGGHVSFFSPRSLAALAARTGFRVARVRTGGVKFGEKGAVPPWRYRLGKLVGELLAWPAGRLGKGHQMEAFLVAVDSPTQADAAAPVR